MFILGKERDYIVHDDVNVKGFFGEYRFLSNFHVAPVYFEGILYPSTEHAYQAAKTLDQNIRLEFLSLTCNEAKNKGQTLEIREDWEVVKYEVMFAVVFDKFTRHPDLKQKLLLTGEKYLEETNHWKDVYWGVCDGKGKNTLGDILMQIRKIIKINPAYTGIPLAFFD